MTDGKRKDFSASNSALGYLYQIRFTLLSSLQRLARDELFAAYIETLDDVTFEQAGSAPELLQLKHHCDRAANLTDASPVLWKSFRIWMEGRADGRIPGDAHLFLVTTSKVGDGSAASYLTANSRDDGQALQRLRATATTSTSDTNKTAYKLFKNLSLDAQAKLIGSVEVIPGALNINNLDEALREEARLAVRRDHLDSFITRLEGWWYRRAITQLVDPKSQPILSGEIENEIDDLREQFKSDALPVDQDILQVEVDTAAYEDSVFVHQVKLAGVGNRRILAAICDYYRAFEQRSRWVREELLLVGELDKYEQLLKEEWEIQFDRITDQLGADAAEVAKRKAAQEVYAWVEASGCAERFVSSLTHVLHLSDSGAYPSVT